MSTIAINHPDTAHARHLQTIFQQQLPHHSVIIWDKNKSDDTIKYLITWKPNEDVFNSSSLSIIFGLGAGVDAFVSREDIPKHIKIVRLEEAGMGNQMLEFALYGILHYSRDFVKFQQARKTQNWLGISTPKLAPFSTKIGIMGLGQLGGYIAQKLSAMGYQVSGYSYSPKNINNINCYTKDDIDVFLSESEVLINLLPLTSDTTDILNRALFEKLPNNAYLINIARGGHLKEEDLIPAIEAGLLQGAMLDVFKTEPLPKTHPFWQDDRIIITPHLAAITLEREAVRQISHNINAYESGQAMTGLVDRNKGY